VKDAAVTTALHGQPAPAEDGKHGGVFGKHLSLEALHSSLPGDVHEMLQDKRCNAKAPIVAVGHEGDFGFVRTRSLSGVASSANQGLAILSLRGDDESNHLAEIDIGQLLEFAVAQFFLGAEEAPVHRLTIQVLECFQKAALVASLNGPNGDSGAILQDFVGGVGSRSIVLSR